MAAIFHFCVAAPHGQNFAPTFFEFEHKAIWCSPLFANENQKDWLIQFNKNSIFGAEKSKFSKLGKLSVDFN